MESPTIAIAPVVERVEEMNCYLPPAMFEVPHVTAGQNFNSAHYHDWGANSFSESRRRGMRNKNHHNSRRSHQQPAWVPDCGPAPPSPAWQPQPQPPPPLVAEANFSSFQEPSGPIAVNLQGLPAALCRQNFLEAMLDQAGLADDIVACVLGEDQGAGEAAIYLANYGAAVKCVQHFGGRRWSNAGPAVTAQMAEGEGTSADTAPPTPNAAGCAPANLRPTGGAGKPRNSKNGQEQLNLPPAALGFPGAWAMPQPVAPTIVVQDYQKASGYGGDSPNTAGSQGSNSPKTRWADLADDDKEDLSEGLEGSTSAGSTGRAGQEAGESFFFGCDVDTDDGF